MSPVVVACIRAMAVLSALQDQNATAAPRWGKGFQLDLFLPCDLSPSFRLYFN